MATARKTPARKLSSITAKTRTAALRIAFVSRAKRLEPTKFDTSLPTDLRFKGLAVRHAHKPTIHITSHPKLSPYTIHLTIPETDTLDAFLQKEAPALRTNLLVPDHFFLSPETALLTPPGDLTLDLSDVASQLKEDGRLASVPRDQRLVHAEKIAPIFTDVPRPTFAVHELNPIPQDLLERLVLPEAEEAELVVAQEQEEPLPTFDLLLAQMEQPLAPIQEVTGDGLRVTELATEPETQNLKPETSNPKPLTLTSETPFVKYEIPDAKLELPSFKLPSFSLPKITLPSFSLPRLPALPKLTLFTADWQRALAAFVFLAIGSVLPLHAITLVSDLRHTKEALAATGESAVATLSQGADAALARDLSSAAKSFERADKRFADAANLVGELGTGTSLLLSVLPITSNAYRSGQSLIAAGQAFAQAGSRLSEGVLAAQTEISPTPVSRLNLLAAYVRSALPSLEEAASELADVDSSAIPEEHRDTFAELETRLPTLIRSMQEFDRFSDMAATVLGGDGSMRYLVLFQNNTEIRATGGFLGSFAEIDVKDGVITKMDVPGGGSYDLQGSLKDFLVAPEPLRLLSARWEFQDANWFPDFPTTARQASDMYVAAGGPSVDGVIAINATYVSDLLALLGPIEMPEYGRIISDDNFLVETQKIVELEYDREENKPKAFIGDLAPRILERLMDGTPEDFFSVLDHVNQGLGSRDIQLYFQDDQLERRVLDLGWGGELKQTTGDYLMIVNTNLGGGKTDGVIDEEVDVLVKVDTAGKLTNTVTISRTHTGEAGELFTGANNVNYVRVYVPKDSVLIASEGFNQPDIGLFETPEATWIEDDDLLYAIESTQVDPISGTTTYEEAGKTVFGNWVQTRPGTTSTISFTYTLPFTLESLSKTPTVLSRLTTAFGMTETEAYTLTLQKQSGINTRHTQITFQLPPGWNTLWNSNDSRPTYDNQTDHLYATLIGKSTAQ